MPGSRKDQRDRFRSEWNERFRGPFNSHGIATVDGNVTVTKLAENMRDMDMTEGRRFLRDAVLEHFGVPREIMGITESSNRATSEAAQYIYAQNVIMPRLNRREEAINTQILPFYGNDLVWHFDDVVPRSQEFDKAKGIDGWNAALLTKDEARELLGMEPCKTGGDCFKITISDMFIGSNDDPAEVTTDLMQESTDEVEVTDDEDAGGMLFMSDRREHEEKSRTQNIGNLLAAAQKAQRAKFEVATMKFFKQQQKRLSGTLSGTEKADWSVWDVLMPYITENHVEDSAAWSALGEQEQKNLVEQFIGGRAYAGRRGRHRQRQGQSHPAAQKLRCLFLTAQASGQSRIPAELALYTIGINGDAQSLPSCSRVNSSSKEEILASYFSGVPKP